MVWLYPTAAIALVALAAPLLVHILARRRAVRLPFPTLRFIKPHALASVRRRALDDASLLALRAVILTLAVGALAGPFLLTAARNRAWDARTVSAQVSDQDVREGLLRAVSWFDRQAPGRREIVVRGFLPIGSITDADIEAIPQHIGIRFERIGDAPGTRSLGVTPVVDGGTIVEREMTLNGDRTSIRDVRSSGAAQPAVEIMVPVEQQPAADRLRAAFANERVPAALQNRLARVAFGSHTTPPKIAAAWMVDAAAQIARVLNASLASRGGIALQFGSDGQRLLVSTPMTPGDPRAIDVLRATARSLAPSPDRTTDEIVPIPEEKLHAWSRDPAPAAAPTKDMIERDDRRWLWGMVILLMAVEWWIRRERPAVAESAGDSSRAA